MPTLISTVLSFCNWGEISSPVAKGPERHFKSTSQSVIFNTLSSGGCKLPSVKKNGDEGSFVDVGKHVFDHDISVF